MNYARYTRSEIEILLDYVQKYEHLTYATTQEIQSEYVARTGSWRSSGALYQAAYRAEQGYYNDLV
jgi:hypothetical protein